MLAMLRSTTVPVRGRKLWRGLRWALAAGAVPLALFACNSHPLEQPMPAPEQQTDLLYEVNPVRKLDLIFMIDNSSSMTAKQDNLRNNFPGFMQELTKIQGGAPDMHIAVISSTVGAGPTTPAAECYPGGDRGRFQVRPECGIDTTKSGYFLKIDAAGKTNFEELGGLAKLPDVFKCMAALGVNGCGYEHQLLSLYFSVDGRTNPENAGFLRDDAYLGVVLLSDEDDCSAEPTANFFASPIAGQSGSVRCSLLGHQCNGQPVPPMPFSTPLSNCKPYERDDATEKDSRLINVGVFVDFLKTVVKKGRSDKILVSTVIGWDDSPDAKYSIIEQPSRNGGTEIDTGPICNDQGAGAAAPGLRLHTFAKAFENNTVFPICKTDLSPAMTEIGRRLRLLIENTCITAPLYDRDADGSNGVQPDCEVLDQVPLNDGTNQYKEQYLQPCVAGGAGPCWSLTADPLCGSGYRTEVTRPVPAAAGTLQSIKCLTCPTGSTDPHCVRKP